MFHLRQNVPSRRQVAQFTWLFVAIGLLLCVNRFAIGQLDITEPTNDEKISFSEGILPILQKNCIACHNSVDREGDLLLESSTGIREGGGSGPAVIPGNASESLLLLLASHADEPIMPPEGNDVSSDNLTPEQLGLLKRWIDQGAIGDDQHQTLSPRTWAPLPEGIHPVYALSLSQDGQFLACGRANQIHLYHVPTGQLVTRLTDEQLGEPGVAHRDLVQSLTFNRQGDFLASGGFREVKIWKRPRDVQQQRWTTETAVRHLAISPDRKRLATIGPNNTIQIWDRDSGEVVREISGHTAEITNMKFGPLNQSLVSIASDKTVRLWQLKDGSEIGRIETPYLSKAITWVRRPNETEAAATETWQHQLAGEYWLVTGDDDQKLRVWMPPCFPLPAATASEGDETSTNSETKAVDATPTYLVQEFGGHSQEVTELIAFTGEVGQVISSSRDGTARHWNVDTGRQMTQFNHGGPVLSVAVAADGTRVATAGENKSAKVWNVNGQAIAELKGDLRTIQHRDRLEQELRAANTRVNVAKQQLAAAEADLPKKQEVANQTDEALATANQAVEEQTKLTSQFQMEKNDAEQLAIEASLAAKQALEAKLSAERDRDLAAGELAVAQEKVKQIEAAARLASENKQLQERLVEAQQEIGQLNQTVQQLTSQIAEPTQLAQKKSQEANSLAQQAAEKQKPYNDALTALKSAEADQNLASQQQVLAALELKRAKALPEHLNERIQMYSQQVSDLEMRFAQANQAARDAELPIHSVAFSPDGRVLLTAGDYPSVHAWNANEGTAIAAYSGHEGSVFAASFLDEATLLSGGQDGTLRVWEASPEWTLEETIGDVDQPQMLSHRVTSLDFNQDSSSILIASGIPSRSGDLLVYDLDRHEPITIIKDAHADAIYSASFSPDGKRIASAGADKYVRLFDAESGELQRRLEGHTNYVLSVSWQGDGTQLASAAGDETIKVWDAETGDQQRTIANMTKPRTAVKFVGETNTIISSGGDRRVRLHDVRNGRVIRNFNQSTTWLHCVDVTPNGELAAVGSADGTIIVFNGTNGQILHTLEVPIGEELSDD